MKALILMSAMIFSMNCHADDVLRGELEKVYTVWREAVIGKDARTWQQVTAEHRRVEVRNRILSEKLPFPASVFNLPTPPPSLKGLKFLEATRNGRTAKVAYFGEIDFGVGGEPTNNLLVLSFIQGANHFLYDKADFVNLSALPDVRRELAAGNLDYLKGVPEAQPSGQVPETPIAVTPAETIAKVYVFCPGREVEVMVNKVSRHRFANAKDAQTIMGGARLGANEVQYSIRKLKGGTGNEVLTIRVYLISLVEGIKPIKVFEYQISENEEFKSFDSGYFAVDEATKAKLAP